MKLLASDRAALRQVLADTPLLTTDPELESLARDAIRGGLDDLRDLMQVADDLDRPYEQRAALAELAAGGLLMADPNFHRMKVLGDLRERLTELHAQARASGVLT